MSLALIEDLAEAAARLRQAMQRADLGDIEQAVGRFRATVDAVQAVGAWRTDAPLKARIREIMSELDAARILACLLGDKSGQMCAAIAARNLDAPQPTYRAR